MILSVDCGLVRVKVISTIPWSSVMNSDDSLKHITVSEIIIKVCKNHQHGSSYNNYLYMHIHKKEANHLHNIRQFGHKSRSIALLWMHNNKGHATKGHTETHTNIIV